MIGLYFLIISNLIKSLACGPADKDDLGSSMALGLGVEPLSKRCQASIIDIFIPINDILGIKNHRVGALELPCDSWWITGSPDRIGVMIEIRAVRTAGASPHD